MSTHESVQPNTFAARGNPGLVAGVLGCVFAVLGILFIGAIFVPLAALCGVVGLVRGSVGRSPTGIGTSLLALLMSVIGFFVSPSLWLLIAAITFANTSSGGSRIAVPVPTPEQLQAHVSQEATRLTERIQNFEAAVAKHVSRTAAVRPRYLEITSKMKAYLERERQLVGDPDALSARDEITEKMHEGEAATTSLNDAVQNIRVEFARDGGSLRRSVESAAERCTNIENRNFAECNFFLSGLPMFFDQYERMERTLADLDAAYKEAARAQAPLVRESEDIW
jgi:hypothetical protein